MRNETILNGIGLSFVYSLLVLPVYSLFVESFDRLFAAKLIIVLVMACYLTQLLTGCYRRSGGIVIWVLAIISLATALIFKTSVPVMLVFAAIAICGLRSYLAHTNTFWIVIDLALSCLSAGFAIWGLAATASIVAAIWCFFLMQALAALIPKRGRMKNSPYSYTECGDRFARARHMAESSLRKMGTARATGFRI